MGKNCQNLSILLHMHTTHILKKLWVNTLVKSTFQMIPKNDWNTVTWRCDKMGETSNFLHIFVGMFIFH